MLMQISIHTSHYFKMCTKCKWRIHASVLPDKKTFMVKTMNSEHTCIRTDCTDNTNASTAWIADKLNQMLNVDPTMSYELMHSELKKKWGIDVQQWQMYRARAYGRQASEGSHEDSFKQLQQYIHHLKEFNPGTIMKLQFHPRANLDDTPTFK